MAEDGRRILVQGFERRTPAHDWLSVFLTKVLDRELSNRSVDADGNTYTIFPILDHRSRFSIEVSRGTWSEEGSGMSFAIARDELGDNKYVVPEDMMEGQGEDEFRGYYLDDAAKVSLNGLLQRAINYRASSN